MGVSQTHSHCRTRTRWARRCGGSPHAVTLAHADALLAEWRGGLWGDPALRTALWAEVAALFRGCALPPALAARWLVARARALAAEGAVEPAEQLALLQVRSAPPHLLPGLALLWRTKPLRRGRCLS